MIVVDTTAVGKRADAMAKSELDAAAVAVLHSCMDRQSPVDDTSAEAREVMRQLYAAMTPAEKLRRMSELTLAANQLALAGLQSRYPDESRSELLLRLARLRLGDELVDQVYGPQRGA